MSMIFPNWQHLKQNTARAVHTTLATVEAIPPSGWSSSGKSRQVLFSGWRLAALAFLPIEAFLHDGLRRVSIVCQ
jgi:hypothetical protein